jgi:hypothetical protein
VDFIMAGNDPKRTIKKGYAPSVLRKKQDESGDSIWA